jgi:hypothetical protein
MSSKTTTEEAGAFRTGKCYDETFKRDAVRLRQQTGRPRAQVTRVLGSGEVSLAASDALALAEVACLRAEFEHMTRQREISSYAARYGSWGWWSDGAAGDEFGWGERVAEVGLARADAVGPLDDAADDGVGVPADVGDGRGGP